MIYFWTLWFVAGLWGGVTLWKCNKFWQDVKQSSLDEHPLMEHETTETLNKALTIAKVLCVILSTVFGFVGAFITYCIVRKVDDTDIEGN